MQTELTICSDQLSPEFVSLSFSCAMTPFLPCNLLFNLSSSEATARCPNSKCFPVWCQPELMLRRGVYYRWHLLYNMKCPRAWNVREFHGFANFSCSWKVTQGQHQKLRENFYSPKIREFFMRANCLWPKFANFSCREHFMFYSKKWHLWNTFSHAQLLMCHFWFRKFAHSCQKGIIATSSCPKIWPTTMMYNSSKSWFQFNSKVITSRVCGRGNIFCPVCLCVCLRTAGRTIKFLFLFPLQLLPQFQFRIQFQGIAIPVPTSNLPFWFNFNSDSTDL